MKTLEQTIKVGTQIILKQPYNYQKPLKEELRLLGIEADNSTVMAAGHIVKKNGTFEKAKAAIQELTEAEVQELAKQEDQDIKAEKQRIAKEKKESELDRKEAEVEQAKRTKLNSEFIQQLVKEFFKQKPPEKTKETSFSDYTVIARPGDSPLKLRYPVKEAMADGWVPLGGIHIAGPLPNGVMLFSQAMGLPVGTKLKKYDY